MTAMLHELRPGCRARVVRVGGDDVRIADMGVTPGTWIEVRRVAPAGDPIEIWVRGYRLLMRKSEAARITVQVG